jgi:hypothetical protein
MDKKSARYSLYAFRWPLKLKNEKRCRLMLSTLFACSTLPKKLEIVELFQIQGISDGMEMEAARKVRVGSE